LRDLGEWFTLEGGMGNALETGTVVGGFRIVSLIGEGAMGAVYLAEDDHGQRVALKRLAPELACDERFRQRFLRESEVAASLHHPSIVPVVSSGEDDGLLYLAMAFIDGPDLRELLRQNGPLEPERAVRFVGQVADALDAAHAAGLVHRDVKPGNILVASTQEGERALICDFGLARHVSSVSSLTGERGFVGTIDYVSPEQIEGRALDARTDIYSLGCVLYELLCGERPFERDSELAVVFAHLSEPSPRVTDVRPELPEPLDSVVATALAKSPDERFQSAKALAQAAREALQGKTRRPRRPRHRLLLAAAAVVAAVGAVIGGVFATHGQAPVNASLVSHPKISQSSIAGARLGLSAPAYKKRFGGWRAETLTQPNYPALLFEDPKVAVYFPPRGKKAIIITTWNRDYKTAENVGPCSSVRELKTAYGSNAKPSSHARAGGKLWAYTVGKNLLFAVRPQTQRIAVVALYGGGPGANKDQGSEAYANFVAQSEAPCA
jgi:serine/threonine-protein kinase